MKPTNKPQESWIKDFNMFWRKSFLSNVDDVNGRDYDSLKQFISQERTQLLEQVREEIRVANNGYLCDVCNSTDHKWCGKPHKTGNPFREKGGK